MQLFPNDFGKGLLFSGPDSDNLSMYSVIQLEILKLFQFFRFLIKAEHDSCNDFDFQYKVVNSVIYYVTYKVALHNFA